jgi:cyclic pyranopterin phosphate synthase
MTDGEAGIAGIRDSFGRTHTYLRLSVTEACNYRCQYCGPGVVHRGLSDDHVVLLCSLFRSMGIRTLRLTGGEPTVRPGLIPLIVRLSSLGFERLALTTNGTSLVRDARALRKAGIQSVNVSLDAVDADLYASLTGGFPVRPVLEGIGAALSEGLAVKLNAVLLADTYRSQVRQLMDFAGKFGIPLRFIELMPFGDGARCEGVSTATLVAFLGEEYGEEASVCPPQGLGANSVSKGDEPWGSGPAEYRRFGGVDVGLIGALTSCFCSRCQRLRLTNEGWLKTCLYHSDHLNLSELLDRGCSQDEMRGRIADFVLTKRLRHAFQSGPVEWPLSSVGG